MKESEAEEVLARYEQSVSRLGALPEHPMRRAALGQTISELEPDHAVWWIDQLLRGALWGRTPEIDAMLACADWLMRQRAEDNYAQIEAMFRAAAESDRHSVLALLRDPPPHRSLRPGARLPEVRLPMERDVTVGERRSLARGQNRDLLQRLLADPDPLVLDKLLDNPAVTVSDCLTVASRRPTTPQLLSVVIGKTRWFREHAVREALAVNPYNPTGISLKLLPTLHVQVLRQIRNAGDLHPVVHDAAAMFVLLREEHTAPLRI